MRYIVALLMLCFTAGAVQAQEVYTSSGRSLRQVEAKKKKDARGFSWDKVVVGGGLGLGFGTITSVSLSPKVGYKITDKFMAGVGLGYNYFKWKDYWELTDINGNTDYYDYKTSIWSVSAWARYVVWKNFFVHAEYQHNFMSFTDYGYDRQGNGTIQGYKTNYNAPSLLLGAGFRQPVAERFAVSFMLFYDVLQDQYSPYYQQVVPQIDFYMNF
ncbi:outer membrane protein [Chitinophagaceae bacterium MMS25-I14]